MYQIIYASEATEIFNSDQLAELLTTARRRNRINRLTGMLVFCNQQFLQVLEGDPADVIATYDRIAQDPRHQDLMAVHRGYSTVGESFAASSMGFWCSPLDEQPPRGPSEDEVPNFFQFDGLMALDYLTACAARLNPVSI